MPGTAQCRPDVDVGDLHVRRPSRLRGRPATGTSTRFTATPQPWNNAYPQHAAQAQAGLPGGAAQQQPALKIDRGQGRQPAHKVADEQPRLIITRQPSQMKAA